MYQSAEFKVGIKSTKREETEEAAREGFPAFGATGEKRLLTGQPGLGGGGARGRYGRRAR